MTDTPSNLDAVVSLANADIKPKLLTLAPKNFEVLSVKALKSSTSTHNTLVKVRIDLAAHFVDGAIPVENRYSTRNVELTRINLRDVFDFRAIERNEQGQYVATIGDVATLNTTLGAEFSEDDVEFIVVDDVTLLRAKPNSLGFIGTVTLAGVAEGN